MSVVINVFEYLIAHPGIFIFCFLLYVFIFSLSLFFPSSKPGRNPFKFDTRKPPKPLVIDQRKRDDVLKEGFAAKKIPSDLDAVVIGSGAGGLGVAAILAKAGKKVLVLEQHDQAGGCCHTFIEKGFEFDVGIHYIGEMRNNTVLRLLIEQITEGQLCWENLIDEMDVVAIGEPGKQKFYPHVTAGKEQYKAGILRHFPDEEEAIDKFLSLIQEVRKSTLGHVMLKMQSRWISRFLINTGLIHKVTKFFNYSSKTLAEVLDELTDNKELKAVLGYCFGDYGTLPKDASFATHAMLLAHFMYGTSYPRGGASEIAFHMIPVIEKSGGRVLVRAPVSEILCENGRAVGVRVHKSSGDIDIHAPLVLSDAGVTNTFTKLLPKEIAQKSVMQKFIKKKVDVGKSALQLFVGLNGSTEELGLKAENIWAFTSNEFDDICQDYLSMSREDALNADVPLLFISFPSSKDSTYKDRFPGKSVATIVTFTNWEWFEEWENERVQKRGADYESIKQAFGRKIWNQVLSIYPHLADKVEYFEVGSPLTNNYYINSTKGEIYGLDHNMQRFSDPEIVMNLRPETDIPGLMLTGQDVFNGGFVGALFGGVLCASKALNRNIYEDMVNLKKKIAKDK